MTDADAHALVRTMVSLGAGAPHGYGRDDDGLGVMVSGCPVATLNGVLVARRGAAAEVSVLLDEVAATGLPYCLESRPGDDVVEALARERGLVPEEQVPLMVHRDPAALDPGDAPIRRMAPDEFGTHLDVMAAAFEAPRDLFAPLHGFTEPDGIRLYVLEADGDVVATALGATVGDHVAVFNVATLPAYRRRGYGAALTARAVRDGVEAGATTALLQSSTLGYGVYERLGFVHAEHWTVWVENPGATVEP